MGRFVQSAELKYRFIDESRYMYIYKFSTFPLLIFLFKSAHIVKGKIKN